VSKLTLIFVWGPVIGFMVGVLGSLVLVSLVLGKLSQLIV